MTTDTSRARPRTQAELDAYFAARKRPTFHSFKGMYPLHEDIELSDEQVRIVKDYLKEVNFHLPGATPEEFNVVRWARYTGFQFLTEPLEAYAVGLRCTHPGMEDHHTFIRMSWGQLMGVPDAERLPVNEPVLASDMMTLQRYRDTPTGPSRTGVDSYTGVAGDGPPGVDFDLKLLNGALDDVLELHARGDGDELNSWWNPAIHWGVAMAGRYPRLKYYESKGRLTAAQASALREFEERAVAARPALDSLRLVFPERIATEALEQADKAERGKFVPRLRIRNPRREPAPTEDRPWTPNEGK